MLLRCWCDPGDLTLPEDDCQRHGAGRGGEGPGLRREQKLDRKSVV